MTRRNRAWSHSGIAALVLAAVLLAPVSRCFCSAPDRHAAAGSHSHACCATTPAPEPRSCTGHEPSGPAPQVSHRCGCDHGSDTAIPAAVLQSAPASPEWTLAALDVLDATGVLASDGHAIRPGLDPPGQLHSVPPHLLYCTYLC